MARHISYQVCINFFVYHHYGETKVYTIRNSFSEYFLAAWFSVGSLLLGVWKIPGISTFGNAGSVFRAIQINFNGGNDYTKYLAEKDFSDKTNFIWNNLSRESRSHLNRKNIDALLEIQESYQTNTEVLFDDKNIQYLRSHFRNESEAYLEKITLSNFLAALQTFESLVKEMEE